MATDIMRALFIACIYNINSDKEKDLMCVRECVFYGCI